MVDDTQACQAGVQSETESVIGSSLFDVLAKSLKFVSQMADSVICIDSKMISSSTATGKIYAEMYGLVMSINQMTIFHDKDRIKKLLQMSDCDEVRIWYDAESDAYYANNGHIEHMIGQKAKDQAHVAMKSIRFISLPQDEFSVSVLKRHIGNAESGYLSLYEDELEQITPDGKGTFTFNEKGARYLKDRTPDVKLSVRTLFKALKLNLNEMSLQVGKVGNDYYVEFIADYKNLVKLRMQEKAEII